MTDWSRVEVASIVADYFQMLQREISGTFYSKTEHRNKLKRLLENRSDGSIEFKHQNISAVLIKYGFPYIKGYKPRSNYQQLLEGEVLNYLSQNKSIEKKFDEFINPKIEIEPRQVQYKNWSVSPPEPSVAKEPKADYFKPVKKNYLELEQKNRNVGASGEQLVFEYEKWRLVRAGLPKLADEVKWISRDLGDGAGFDILSKNTLGKDIFIEVKSTTLGKETPIFFSKRENDFSNLKNQMFNLYRVFGLKDNPKMFCLTGRYKDFCRMEADNFRGYF
jgi:hypothetical protein